MSAFYPSKRRRTATSVFAGDFDPHPPRDVLTSLLNGVPINKSVEKDEEARRVKKEKKREKEREKMKELLRENQRKSSSKSRDKAPIVASTSQSASAPPAPVHKKPTIVAPMPLPAVSTFWQTRPAIHIATNSRSVSVTPPPMMSSPSSTPGPSMSSATSATSSKRPYTPDDDEELTPRGGARSTWSPQPSSTAPPMVKPPRKKRVAARKGWKGWVEGELPESKKLINLDVAPTYAERKTRSGKCFDAIAEGKEHWV